MIRDLGGRLGEQGEGVLAQVLFGAPTLLASVMLARLGGVALVSELALAAGVSATLFTALSFGLRPFLAIHGIVDFAATAFWQNRLLGSLAAAIVAIGASIAMGTSASIAVAVCLLKLSDSLADLKNGFQLMAGSPRRAARILLGWSAVRLIVFLAGVAVAGVLGWTPGRMILCGAVSQGVIGLPWKEGFTHLRTAWNPGAVIALGRRAVPFSLAASACALLVTIPRGLATHLLAGEVAGYAGIAFMAGTLVGMSFNVVWIRAAVLARSGGISAVHRRLLVEGAALAILLAGGIVVSSPVVAIIFGVDDAAFRSVFTGLSLSLVLLFFAMSHANILKLSRWPIMESLGYLLTAAVLWAGAMLTRSLVAGVLAGAVVLFLIGTTFAGRQRAVTSGTRARGEIVGGRDKETGPVMVTRSVVTDHGTTEA